MAKHPEKILRDENSRTTLTISLPDGSDVDYTSVSWRFPQYLATIFATFGALAAGTTLGWTSPALPMLKSNGEGDGMIGLNLTASEGSWVGSVLTLGACLGALPSGPLSDRLGRKRLLTAMSLPFLMSWLLVSFAPNVHVLYTARFLAGISTGAVSVVIPIYVGEISEHSIRGTLGSFFQLMLTLGILLSYTFGEFFGSYALLAIASSVTAALFMLGALWIPESPQYLLAWGRKEEASRSLMWLRGVDNPLAVERELSRMEHDLAISAKEALDRGGSGTSGAVRELLMTPHSRKAMLVALGLMTFQQLSGINAVIFYTESIFHSALTSFSAGLGAVIFGIVQFAVTMVAVLLVERVGRRFLLCLSSLAGAISLCSLGVYFHLQNTSFTEGSSLQNLEWLPLVSLASFVVAYSLGLGPLPWAMIGELFPSSVKGTAGALAVTVNWMLAFVVTKNFSSMRTVIGSDGVFWVFSVICALCVMFVAFFVPETKGKSPHEIQEALGGEKRTGGARQWRKRKVEPIKLMSPI